MRHTASGMPAHTFTAFHRLTAYRTLRRFVGPVLAFRLSLGRA
ncbi:MAG: hypothetical protein WCY08_01830 [Rhodocyclaceae bacterium]